MDLVANLEPNSNEQEIYDDVLYGLLYGYQWSNIVTTLAINKNKRIIPNSSFWLSWFKSHGERKDEPDAYVPHRLLATKLYRTKKYIHIKENVAMFICNYFKGTVHMFVYFFDFLYGYMNKCKEQNFIIGLYSDSNNNILELIDFFFPNVKKIYFDKGNIYKIDKLFLVNSFDCYYTDESLVYVDQYIKKINNVKPKETFNKVAIIKYFSDMNSTEEGCYEKELVFKFCDERGYAVIDPYLYGEIETIRIIYNCEHIMFSYGTAYNKNYVYISEKCKNIHVFIPPEMEFQYTFYIKSHDFTKYKNADVHYYHDDGKFNNVLNINF